MTHASHSLHKVATFTFTVKGFGVLQKVSFLSVCYFIVASQCFYEMGPKLGL